MKLKNAALTRIMAGAAVERSRASRYPRSTLDTDAFARPKGTLMEPEQLVAGMTVLERACGT